MEQYPGDGSPNEADSSPDGDDLSRLRRVGWQLGYAVAREVERRRGGSMTFEPGRKPSSPTEGWKAKDAEVFKAAVIDGAREALEQERANPDTMDDALSVYPSPLLAGAAAYRDPGIWSADWRATLDPSHPDAPSPEQPLVSHDDPNYRSLLRIMFRT